MFVLEPMIETLSGYFDRSKNVFQATHRKASFPKNLGGLVYDRLVVELGISSHEVAPTDSTRFTNPLQI